MKPLNRVQTKRFTPGQFIIGLVSLFFGITVIAYAAITLPNTFTSGTTISSSQVNANFLTLATAMPAAKTVVFSGALVSATTGTNMTSLTVTPPSTGFIILSASGSLGLNQSVAGYSRVNVFLTTISGQASTVDPHQIWLVDTAGGTAQPFNWAPFHVQGIFPVTGGVATTFYLTAIKGAVTTDYSAFVGTASAQVRLTALFVPGTALP